MTSQQPDHKSNPLSGISDGPSAPIPLVTPSDKPSGPTLGTRLIIFSALVLPSALIPILVLRRSVNNLHRRVDELRVATRDLHHEFKSVMMKLSVRRKQHEQLQAMIAETRDGLKQLHGEMYRRRKAGARDDERMQGQVQGLEASNQAQILRLRELGTSLADVAAFMQEMELHQGFFTPRFDGKGIERLRFLAMQFEGLGKANAADANVSSFVTTINERYWLCRLIVDNNRRAMLQVIRDATQAQMWIRRGLNEVVLRGLYCSNDASVYEMLSQRM